MSDISYCDIKMPQNNGLLVDVDIEPVKSENENRTDATNVTFDVGGGGGGENEVNSNVASVNKNIFDAIDSIQIEAIGASAGKQRERMNSVDSTHSIRSYDSTGLSLEEKYMQNYIKSIFAGVESAHSGEALLPDVGYTSASGSGGGSSRSNPRQKKNKRGERTPLVGGRNRNRSDYEDLDDETFNNWPSKFLSIFYTIYLVMRL